LNSRFSFQAIFFNFHLHKNSKYSTLFQATQVSEISSIGLEEEVPPMVHRSPRLLQPLLIADMFNERPILDELKSSFDLLHSQNVPENPTLNDLTHLASASSQFFTGLRFFAQNVFFGWRPNLPQSWGVESSITTAALHGLQDRVILDHTMSHFVLNQRHTFTMLLTKLDDTSSTGSSYPPRYVDFNRQQNTVTPGTTVRLGNVHLSSSHVVYNFVDFGINEPIGPASQPYAGNLISSFVLEISKPKNMIQVKYMCYQSIRVLE